MADDEQSMESEWRKKFEEETFPDAVDFETQNGDYLETFDSVKCVILKSHY